MTIEDHPVFRDGLRMIMASQPDMLLVCQMADAGQALPQFRRCRPDVTLIDHRLSGASGTDCLIAIRSEFPCAQVIMLSTGGGDIDVQRALRAGAAAYLLKSTTTKELLQVIRDVARGGKYIPPDIATLIVENLASETLSPRELEVLNLIRNGTRNKQIADRLSIAESTVNFHIKNIVGKLKANDRTHAVVIALRRGFLQI